jgi:hypothetical protein
MKRITHFKGYDSYLEYDPDRKTFVSQTSFIFENDGAPTILAEHEVPQPAKHEVPLRVLNKALKRRQIKNTSPSYKSHQNAQVSFK